MLADGGRVHRSRRLRRSDLDLRTDGHEQQPLLLTTAAASTSAATSTAVPVVVILRIRYYGSGPPARRRGQQRRRRRRRQHRARAVRPTFPAAAVIGVDVPIERTGTDAPGPEVGHVVRLPVQSLRVPKPLQLRLLLLLLQPVRHVSCRVDVAVVVDERRLDNGIFVAGRSVAVGRLAVLMVVDGRVTRDVRRRSRRRRRRRLLVLVVAARENGGRQQPSYALLFGAVVGVRRFRRRGRSRRYRRAHIISGDVTEVDYATYYINYCARCRMNLRYTSPHLKTEIVFLIRMCTKI
ncbi:hypothetical protein AGLY_011722 [Aphis glycines]|uniref:Uncharacterized protein n=1 Tax=Aphis glycines TaxID=307491 RepID=A0A6G0TB07_APHGL|nr:hypothetical protein AGLY_011722 [Aphis glycines]